MRAGHLTIDEPDVARATLFDQSRQRYLGRVALEAEHRFAKKDLSQLDAVQTADQQFLPISFYRVAKPEFVELVIGVDHVGVEPSIGTRAAGRGAGANRLAEGMVQAGAETSVPQRFPQTS